MNLPRRLAKVLVSMLVVLHGTGAVATPVISGTFHYRDQRSANSVGFSVGDRLTFGAGSVVPSGSGTTVTATNPDHTGTVDLSFFPTNAFPNQYANSVAYDADVASNPWNLTASDGIGAPAVAMTPAPGTAGITPFIESFSLSNPGATPTFSWSVPAGSTHTAQSIRIFDLEDALASTGTPPIIFSAGLGSGDSTFSVGAGVIDPNHSYSVAIQLDDFTGGPLRSRSRSFFDFSTSELVVPGAGGPVFLPSVDTSGSSGPVYQFNVGEVVAGQTIFVDPFVAIGYEYEKGPTDQNFASVVLPDVGDGVFSLSFFDGAMDVVTTVMAETPFSFPIGGVGAFTVGGIETSAGLDPNDATAFVTGLTFVAASTFTGTMTPITVFVESVPEPATLLLLGAGLVGLGLVSRRPRQRRSPARKSGVVPSE